MAVTNALTKPSHSTIPRDPTVLLFFSHSLIYLNILFIFSSFVSSYLLKQKLPKLSLRLLNNGNFPAKFQVFSYSSQYLQFGLIPSPVLNEVEQQVIIFKSVSNTDTTLAASTKIRDENNFGNKFGFPIVSGVDWAPSGSRPRQLAAPDGLYHSPYPPPCPCSPHHN